MTMPSDKYKPPADFDARIRVRTSARARSLVTQEAGRITVKPWVRGE
jgi:hypothetical protein